MAIRFASEDETGKSHDVDVNEDGSYPCPSCRALARPEEGGCQNPECEVGRLNREVTRQVEKLRCAEQELKDAEQELKDVQLEASELEYDGKVFAGGARVTEDSRLEWVGPAMSRVGCMIWWSFNTSGPGESRLVMLSYEDVEGGARLPGFDGESGERTDPGLLPGWYQVVSASMLAYGETDDGTPEVLSSVVIHAELERLVDQGDDG